MFICVTNCKNHDVHSPIAQAGRILFYLSTTKDMGTNSSFFGTFSEKHIVPIFR